MVKSGVQPGTGGVARIARLREVRSHVVGIGGALIIRQVTVHARRTGDVVVSESRVVAVAAGARRNRVHTSQRESGRGMVERAVGPGDGVMALLTRSREVRSGVVHRRNRSVVVVLMATDARCARDVVVVVDVAIAALPRRYCVRACQRKSGF